MDITLVPQELADDIIDHLHDDKQSLRSCSLVCRSWLPSSSVHLFRRMRWPPCDHALDRQRMPWNTLANCRCALTEDSPDLQDLLHFLRTTPRARDHVRELHIRFSWFDGVSTPVDGADSESDSGPAYSFDHRGLRSTDLRRTVVTTPAELADIVDTLGALRCLELHDVSLSAPPSSSPDHVGRAARDLDKLCLSSLREGMDCEPLSQFLQHFRCIRTLALHGVQRLLGRARRANPAIRMSGHPPSVDVLQFCGGTFYSTYWLGAFSSMLDLRSLRVLDLLDPDTNQLRRALPVLTQDLIRRCTSLSSLTCVYGLSSRAVMLCPAPCPTLRLLHFHGSQSPWLQIPSDLNRLERVMNSPLTSSVHQLIVNLSVTECGGYCDHPPSDDEARLRVKAKLSFPDWGLFDDFAGRLQSLTVWLSLEIGHAVTEDEDYWRSMAEELIHGQLSLRVREVLRLHIHVSRITLKSRPSGVY